MKESQENKYTIGYNDDDSPRIMNRMTGDIIPDDEPIMIFRAKDSKSIDAIASYVTACTDPVHKVAIGQRLQAFLEYQAENPALVTEPDTQMWPVDG